MGFDIQKDTIYTHDRYTSFYELELGRFLEDLPFYKEYLPSPPASVLELGCGSGRLGRALAEAGYTVTGIDLSLAMLREAANRPLDSHTAPAPRYACMDMTCLALTGQFDAIVIPYNTLNLLTTPDALEQCLQQARALLSKNGRLLMQIFVPTKDHAQLATKKQFQFMIFDRPNGSKVIKEILKWREPETKLINLKETYRVRYQPDKTNEDWQYDYQILGMEYPAWLEKLTTAGFSVTATHGDYHLEPFVAGEHATLLLAASATKPPRQPQTNQE